MSDDAAYSPLFLKGVELFNDCEFFESHDAWEELWAAYSGDDRTFYQGLIQVAVCLHHFCNGNVRGARKLYHSSRKYLGRYSPRHEGVDLVRLFDELERCCAGFLDESADESKIEIDADLIPEIQLEPPPTRSIHDTA